MATKQNTGNTPQPAPWQLGDPEWDALHCTCGEGTGDFHEDGCSLSMIRALERQRAELVEALRGLLAADHGLIEIGFDAEVEKARTLLDLVGGQS